MCYAPDSPLPRLHQVEVNPLEQSGAEAFFVRDPLESAPLPIARTDRPWRRNR